MKIDVLGRDGYVVSDSDKALAEKSLQSIERVFASNVGSTAKVVIKRVGSSFKIEVTITALNMAFRAEYDPQKEEINDTSIRTAFDKVSQKLFSQIRRGKEKIKNRFERTGLKEVYSKEFENEVNELTEIPKKVRTKQLLLTPITLDDAIFELEQSGHSFYIFYDKNQKKVCTLYKRNDGDYGVIEVVSPIAIL